MDINFELHIIIPILSVFLILSGLFLYTKVSGKEKVFLIYVIMSSSFELIAHFSSRWGNNLPGLHIYTLLQFVIITYFFKACLKEFSFGFNWNWILSIGSFLIISNSIFVQNIFTYNGYSKSMVELYIITMSIFLFIVLLKDVNHDQNEMKPSVSFVSAVFLQSSVSIIIYLYMDKILTLDKEYVKFIFDLRALTISITILIIGFGLVQIVKKVRSKATSSLQI